MYQWLRGVDAPDIGRGVVGVCWVTQGDEWWDGLGWEGKAVCNSQSEVYGS